MMTMLILRLCLGLLILLIGFNLIVIDVLLIDNGFLSFLGMLAIIEDLTPSNWGHR